MKKLIIAILFFVLTTGVAFAGGGKNTNQERGTNGSGTVSTGSDAEGAASQSRAGR